MRTFIILLGFALIASTASIVEASSADEVRKALHAEDFDKARQLLGEMAESDETAELEKIVNECELSAICDLAWEHISKGETSQARTLLKDALQRLTASQISLERARGLLGLIGTEVPLTAGLDDATLVKFYKAIEEGDALNEARELKAKALLDKIDKAFEDARAFIKAAQGFADTLNINSARKEYDNAKLECERAIKILQELDSLINQKEWVDRKARIETETNERLMDIARGLGKLLFETREYANATKAVEQGLLLDPNDSQLIELRVQIEEYWKVQIFFGRKTK